MSSSKFDIVVYGATGFTGQLVAEYLAAQYKGDGNLKWAMAGRSKEKLASVRDAIGAPADTPLIVADASDPASLKAMVAQTKSVISDRRSVSALWRGTGRGLCRVRHGLSRSLRRADLDAPDDRQVRGCGKIERRAHCVLLRLRLATVRARYVVVQEEAKRVFGAPASRVKGRVRDMRGTLSGGTAASARATFEAVAKDLSLVAILKDPFALTPGFKGPKQPPGNKPVFEDDLQSWAAPFTMALINTRNVHRSNMLMGFPYGKEFVYDEMVLTGAGEKGEANARLVMAANTEKTGPGAPKPGEGPSKEERENGLYDLLYVAIAPDGRQVRAVVKGDRDPGYGSTSKMISECAICLLRDTPDVPAGIWTPGAAMGDKLIKRLTDHAGLTFEVEK